MVNPKTTTPETIRGDLSQSRLETNQPPQDRLANRIFIISTLDFYQQQQQLFNTDFHQE